MPSPHASPYWTASEMLASSPTMRVALFPSDRTVSFSGLARLGFALSSNGRLRLYVRAVGERLWHSATVGPRDPLDSLRTECQRQVERPALVESYPGDGVLCSDCGARRVLEKV